MKTLVNFQAFTIEQTDSFLNVSTKGELKEWKRKLREYYYVRNAGLKVSKANRKELFKALRDIRMTQTELLLMIENNKSQELKDAHVESIRQLQDFMIELSGVQDVVIEKREPRQSLRTMMYFETIETNENGITFKTKNGKRFSMLSTEQYDKHVAMIDKYISKLQDRKKAEKKAVKAQEKADDKAQKKSDAFAEKVNEKKRKS